MLRFPPRRAHAVVTAALLVLVAASAAHAQPPQPVAPSCFDTIPAEAFTRLPVYLVPYVEGPHAEALRPVSDLFTSMVGERVRAMLGGTPERLPEGSAAIGWRDLGPGVSVTLHRDGTFDWKPHQDGSGAASSPASRSRAATDSLVRALEALRESGERYHWPEGAGTDRLTLDLGFDWQMVSGDGRVEPLVARFAVPVLAADLPRRGPITLVSMPQPRYPQQQMQHGVTATVVMRYVVDERGAVREETIRDLWTSDAPEPRGDAGRVYRGFVRSVRNAIARARFEPATLGGCPVPHPAQQPFVFAFR